MQATRCKPWSSSSPPAGTFLLPWPMTTHAMTQLCNSSTLTVKSQQLTSKQQQNVYHTSHNRCILFCHCMKITWQLFELAKTEKVGQLAAATCHALPGMYSSGRYSSALERSVRSVLGSTTVVLRTALARTALARFRSPYHTFTKVYVGCAGRVRALYVDGYKREAGCIPMTSLEWVRSGWLRSGQELIRKSRTLADG